MAHRKHLMALGESGSGLFWVGVLHAQGLSVLDVHCRLGTGLLLRGDVMVCASILGGKERIEAS